MAAEQTRITLRRLATFYAKLKDVFATKDAIKNLQTQLKWDSTPTLNSTNPVTSDGIRKAIPVSVTGVTYSSGTVTITKSDNTTSTFSPFNSSGHFVFPSGAEMWVE